MASFLHWFRAPSVATLLLSGLVFASVFALRNTGNLQFLELTAYDGLVKLQPRDSIHSAPIILIGITERDIQELARWPLTDAMLAEVLEILVRNDARTIGLDMYRDIPVSPGTGQLEAVLRHYDRIIVVEKFGDSHSIGIPPPSVLRDSDRVGFNDMIVDPGGVVRRGLLFLDDSKTVFYSFALRLALLYLEADGIIPQPGDSEPQALRLGSTTLPPLEANDGGYVDTDARGYQILLGFHGGPAPFPMFSLTDLRAGRVKADVIRDKIVIVGVVSESVKDTFYTPHSGRFSVDFGVSGIVLHAHLVDQLLRSALQGTRPTGSFKDIYETAWILLWSILGSVLGRWIRSATIFALLCAGGLFILALFAYAVFIVGWWIPFVPPAAAWLVSAALTTAYMSNYEKRERGVLMQLFSKHVSCEVASAIWREHDRILEGGRLRSQLLTATVLFTDVKGFTSISERLAPQVLMDWLNSYLESMTRLVMEHGGVVDDYAGDGIKANFGVPLAHRTKAEICQDAMNAVSCGLAMGRKLECLNRLWETTGLPTVYMRLGINTGLVVAGTVGSAERMKYTTVGDCVNVASRLESLHDTPTVGDSKPACRLLVSEKTLHYLDDQYQAKPLGNLSLRGKSQPIAVYQITGGPTDVKPCSQRRRRIHA